MTDRVVDFDKFRQNKKAAASNLTLNKLPHFLTERIVSDMCFELEGILVREGLSITHPNYEKIRQFLVEAVDFDLHEQDLKVAEDVSDWDNDYQLDELNPDNYYTEIIADSPNNPSSNIIKWNRDEQK